MAPLSKLLFAPLFVHGLVASDPRLKSSVSGRAPHRERAVSTLDPPSKPPFRERAQKFANANARAPQADT